MLRHVLVFSTALWPSLDWLQVCFYRSQAYEIMLIYFLAGSFAKMSADGWRWVFYFDAIFFGVSSLLMLVFYNPPPTRLRRENTIMSEFKSVDYIGIFLLLLGVVGLVTSLTWGGNAYAWKSSRVLSMLILGVAFLIAFGLYGESPALCKP